MFTERVSGQEEDLSNDVKVIIALVSHNFYI